MDTEGNAMDRFIMSCMRRWKTSLSLIVIESLLFSSIVLADNSNLLTANDIEIPAGIGQVQDRFCGNPDTIIIHIQDTHTNASSQKYLAMILAHLSSTYDISLAGIEGADSSIDTSEFSRFPDKNVRQKVAEYFLNEGKIDGSEYFSIIQNYDARQPVLQLEGIEVGSLYRENINAYLQSLPHQQHLDRFCMQADKLVAAIKQHVFCPQLRAFDDVIEQFYNNNVHFNLYCQHLASFATKNLIEFDDLKQFCRTMEVIRIEQSIDPHQVETQRFLAIEKLLSALPEEKHTELMQKKVAYQTLKLSAEEYNAYLFNQFETYEVDMSEFDQLSAYLRYIDLATDIDQNTIFQECAELEDRIYTALCQTEQQKQLRDIAQCINLFENFSHLKMTRQDYARYVRLKELYSPSDIVSTLESGRRQYQLSISLPDELDAVAGNIAHFERFYELAHLREKSMVENTLKLAQTHGKKAVVLIAGGFHTRGITELLRDEDASYIVATPNSDLNGKKIAYTSLLKYLRSPLEQMIEAYLSTLKIATWLSESPLVYGERKQVLTAQMKTLFTTTKLFDVYRNLLEKYPQQERPVIKSQLENQLQETINTVLNLAQYDDIAVESVEIQFDESLIAKLSLRGVSDPLYIRTGLKSAQTARTSGQSGSDAGQQLDTYLLDMVTLGDVSNEFMTSLGYIHATGTYRTVRSRILDILLTAPMDFKMLRQSLELNAGIHLSEHQLQQYLDMFAALGYVKLTDSQYHVNDTDPVAFTTAFVLARLFGGSFSDLTVKPGRLDTGTLPQALRAPLDQAQIETIIVEPTVPISDIGAFVKSLYDQSIADSLQPGITVRLSDTSVMTVLKPQNTAHGVIHVLVQPKTDSLPSDAGITQTVTDVGESLETQPARLPLEHEYLALLDTFSADAVARLTDQEKTALMQHIYAQTGVTPAQYSPIDRAVRERIGLTKTTPPTFTRRVGALIFGNEFNDRYSRAVSLLLMVYPVLPVTTANGHIHVTDQRIHEQIIRALALTNSEAITSASWLNLVGDIIAESRRLEIPSPSHEPVLQLNEFIHKQAGKSLNRLDRSALDRLITLFALNSNESVETITQQRITLLDQSITDEFALQFRSRDDQITAELFIIRTESDGSYKAIDRNGDLYTVELLPVEPQTRNFAFSDSQDTPALFQDTAGFAVRKTVPSAEDILSLSQRDLQLKALQGLQQAWQEIIEGSAEDSLETRLTEIVNQSAGTQIPVDTVVQQIESQIALKAQEYDAAVGQTEQSLEPVRRRIREHSDMRAEIERLEATVTKESGSLEDLESQKTQLLTAIDRIDQDMYRQIPLALQAFILQSLFVELQKTYNEADASGSSPQTAINEKLAQWWNAPASKNMLVIMDKQPRMLAGAKLDSIISDDRWDTIRASLTAQLPGNLIAGNVPPGIHQLSADLKKQVVQAIIKQTPRVLELLDAIAKSKTAGDPAQTTRLQDELTELSAIENVVRFFKQQAVQRTQTEEKIRSIERLIRQSRNQMATKDDLRLETLRTVFEAASAQFDYDQAQQQALSNKLSALRLRRMYAQRLAAALELINKQIAAGNESARFGKDMPAVPLIPENIAYLMYGAVYVSTAHKLEQVQRKAVDDPHAASLVRTEQLLLGMAEKDFFARQDGVVTAEQLKQRQTFDTSDLDSLSDGYLLLHGEDTEQRFPGAANLTHHYAVNELVMKAIGYLQSTDPLVAKSIRDSLQVIVSKEPLLPAGTVAIRHMHGLSSEKKIVLIERAVFSAVLKLAQTKPQAAVKLMAAAISFAAQGVSPMLALHDISEDGLQSFFTNNMTLFFPDLTDRQLADIRASIPSAIQSFITWRDTIGSPLTWEHKSDAAAKFGPRLWSMIAPYCSFDDTAGNYRARRAIQYANRLLGGDFQLARNLMRVEHELAARAIDSSLEKQPAAEHLSLSAREQQYKDFFFDTFASYALFDRIHSHIRSFDRSSSPEAYTQLARNLNKLLRSFTDPKKFCVTRQQATDGSTMYRVHYPDGTDTSINEDEFNRLRADLSVMRKHTMFYYHPDQGVGLMWRPDAQLPFSKLPAIVSPQSPFESANELLTQVRSKSPAAYIPDRHITNAAQILALNDQTMAQPHRPVVNIAAYHISESLKELQNQCTSIARRIPDIRDDEKKAVAAWLLMHNRKDMNAIDMVARVYDPSVPVVFSPRIETLVSMLNESSADQRLRTLRSTLLTAISHDAWNTFQPELRRSIFDHFTAQYGITQASDIYPATVDFFTALDYPASQAQPAGWSIQALSFVWNMERSELESHTDTAYSAQRYAYYLRKIQDMSDRLDQAAATGTTPDIMTQTRYLGRLKRHISDTLQNTASSAVQDFNTAFEGLVRIDIPHDDIKRRPADIIGLIAALRQPVAEASDLDADNLARYSLVTSYFDALDDVARGDIARAQKLIASIRATASRDNLFHTTQTLAQLDSVIGAIVAVQRDTAAVPVVRDLTGPLELMVKETINRMPPHLFVSALSLRSRYYSYAGIIPAPGLTDIVLHMTDEPLNQMLKRYAVTQPSILDSLNKEPAITIERDIYLDINKLHFGQPDMATQIGELIGETDALYQNEIEEALGRFEQLGLPPNLRLLALDWESLTTENQPIPLSNAMTARQMMVSSKESGLSLLFTDYSAREKAQAFFRNTDAYQSTPLFLPPAEYDKLITEQKQVLNAIKLTLNTLADTGSHDRAIQLLQDTMTQLAGLSHISQQVRYQLAAAIQNDIARLNREQEKLKTRDIADQLIHLYGPGVESGFAYESVLPQSISPKDVKEVIHLAFDELEQTSPGIYADIMADMTVVVGEPSSRMLYPNTVFINSAKFKFILTLISHDSFEEAGIMLAGEIAQALMSYNAMFEAQQLINSYFPTLESIDPYIQHTQLPDTEQSVLLPLHRQYTKDGQPVPNLRAPMLIVHFEDNVPVAVVNTKTNERYDLQQTDTTPRGYLLMDEPGATVPLGVRILSDYERVLGEIDVHDELYSIARNGHIVAIAKVSDEKEEIIPLVDDRTLVQRMQTTDRTNAVALLHRLGREAYDKNTQLQNPIEENVSVAPQTVASEPSGDDRQTPAVRSRLKNFIAKTLRPTISRLFLLLMAVFISFSSVILSAPAGIDTLRTILNTDSGIEQFHPAPDTFVPPAILTDSHEGMIAQRTQDMALHLQKVLVHKQMQYNQLNEDNPARPAMREEIRELESTIEAISNGSIPQTGQTDDLPAPEFNPDFTYVYDATLNRFVHPVNETGVQITPPDVKPTLTDQFRKDYEALRSLITSNLPASQEAVRSWNGTFLTPPYWSAQTDTLPQEYKTALDSLVPGIHYTGVLQDGAVLVAISQPIDLQSLPGFAAADAAMAYSVVVTPDDVIIQPALPFDQAKKYARFSYRTQRIFTDQHAQPLTFDRASIPALQNLEPGTYTASVDEVAGKLLVTNITAPQLALGTHTLFGTSLFAPDGTQFTATIDETGIFRLTEKVDMTSVLQNPWSPGLAPDQLPEFFAGLQNTGHTGLYVRTDYLVESRVIHDMPSRDYYKLLIDMANDYGIKIYALQGKPHWATADGIPEALQYMTALGNTNLNFAGYVLDIKPNLTRGWEKAADSEKQQIAEQFENLLRSITSIISYNSGADSEIISLAPDELSSFGVDTPETMNDIITAPDISAESIVAQIVKQNPTKPFRIQVSTSVLSEPGSSFGLQEQGMPGILNAVISAVREHPQYGTLFQGIVIQHDAGEDIVQYMKTGSGRPFADRLPDIMHKTPEGTMLYTNGLYEFLISPAYAQMGPQVTLKPADIERIIEDRFSLVSGGLFFEKTQFNVTQTTPEKIFVTAGETPYISFSVDNLTDWHVSKLAVSLDLTNMQTGEQRSASFPLILPYRFNDTIHIPLENLPAGQWSYHVNVLPDSQGIELASPTRTAISSEPVTVAFSIFDVTVAPKDVSANSRMITFMGEQITLVDGPDDIGMIETSTASYSYEDVHAGVVLTFTNKEIPVRIRKNHDNHWILEHGGQAAVIIDNPDGTSQVVVDTPQRLTLEGQLQKGLPDITVSETSFELQNNYIVDTETAIHILEPGSPFTVADHTVNVTPLFDNRLEVLIDGPTGKRVEVSPSSKAATAYTVGDRLVVVGYNAAGQLVASVSAYSTATMTTTVTNTPEATSPVTFYPSVTFYHPLVGTVIMKSPDQYTAGIDESAEVIMQVPVPVDILAQERSKIESRLSQMNKLRTDFEARQTAYNLDIANGIDPTVARRHLHDEFSAAQSQLLDLLKQTQSVIRDIGALNMVSETTFQRIAYLHDRHVQLQKTVNRIERLTATDYDAAGHLHEYIISAERNMQALSAELDRLSNQNIAYSVSIHDATNMIGAPVSADDLLRRVGKDHTMRVLTGIASDADADQVHTDYVTFMRDYLMSSREYGSAMYSVFKTENIAVTPLIPADLQAEINARKVEIAQQLKLPEGVNPRKWDYIVFHHTAGETGDIAAFDKLHRQRFNTSIGLLYHMVINNGNTLSDGQMEVGKRWTQQLQGGHTQSGTINDDGIGISLVGNFENHAPSRKQLVTAIATMQYLLETYDIDPNNVIGHKDINERHTACPGKYFPLEKVKQIAKIGPHLVDGNEKQFIGYAQGLNDALESLEQQLRLNPGLLPAGTPADYTDTIILDHIAARSSSVPVSAATPTDRLFRQLDALVKDVKRGSATTESVIGTFMAADTPYAITLDEDVQLTKLLQNNALTPSQRALQVVRFVLAKRDMDHTLETMALQAKRSTLNTMSFEVTQKYRDNQLSQQDMERQRTLLRRQMAYIEFHERLIALRELVAEAEERKDQLTADYVLMLTAEAQLWYERALGDFIVATGISETPDSLDGDLNRILREIDGSQLPIRSKTTASSLLTSLQKTLAAYSEFIGKNEELLALAQSTLTLERKDNLHGEAAIQRLENDRKAYEDYLAQMSLHTQMLRNQWVSIMKSAPGDEVAARIHELQSVMLEHIFMCIEQIRHANVVKNFHEEQHTSVGDFIMDLQRLYTNATDPLDKAFLASALQEQQAKLQRLDADFRYAQWSMEYFQSQINILMSDSVERGDPIFYDLSATLATLGARPAYDGLIDSRITTLKSHMTELQAELKTIEPVTKQLIGLMAQINSHDMDKSDEIKPSTTVVIDGTQITIAGSYRDQRMTLLPLLEKALTRANGLVTRLAVLDLSIKDLQKLKKELSAPKTAHNLLDTPAAVKESQTLQDYAAQNAQRARFDYNLSLHGKIFAQAQMDAADAQLQDAYASLRKLETESSQQDRSLSFVSQDANAAFIELVQNIIGTRISPEMLFTTTTGDTGVTLRLAPSDQSDTMYHIDIDNLMNFFQTNAKMDTQTQREFKKTAAMFSDSSYWSVRAPFITDFKTPVAADGQPAFSMILSEGHLRVTWSISDPTALMITRIANPVAVADSPKVHLIDGTPTDLQELVTTNRRHAIPSRLHHFTLRANQLAGLNQKTVWYAAAIDRAKQRVDLAQARTENARQYLQHIDRQHQFQRQHLYTWNTDLGQMNMSPKEASEQVDEPITEQKLSERFSTQGTPRIVTRERATTVVAPDALVVRDFSQETMTNKIIARSIYILTGLLSLLALKGLFTAVFRKLFLGRFRKTRDGEPEPTDLITADQTEQPEEIPQASSKPSAGDIRQPNKLIFDESQLVDVRVFLTPTATTSQESAESSDSLVNLLDHQDKILDAYNRNTDGYFKDANHVRRVMQIAESLGLQMGISEQEMDWLKQAALIYELSKIPFGKSDVITMLKVLNSHRLSVFMPTADLFEAMRGAQKHDIESIAASDLDETAKQAKINRLSETHFTARQTLMDIFTANESILRILKDYTGIDMNEQDAVIRIVTQLDREPQEPAGSDIERCAEILRAADIIDSSQARERAQFQLRKTPSIGHHRFGMIPLLKQALKQERISQPVYQAVMTAVAVSEKDDILRQMALARSGIASARTADLIKPISELRREIATYFIDQKKTASQQQKPVTAQQAEKQTETPPKQTVQPVSQRQKTTYTQQTVNDMFRIFSVESAGQLIPYLNGYQPGVSVLPEQIELYKNTLWQDLYDRAQSPAAVLVHLAQLAKDAGFDMQQMVNLLDVLERSGFMPGVNKRREVIVLDFDTLGFSPSENAGNVMIRKELARRLQDMVSAHRNLNRECRVVMFSRQIESVTEMQSMLGSSLGRYLASHGNQLFSNQLLDELIPDEAPPADGYMTWLTMLAREHDVNRVNIKLFTTDETLLESAHRYGAILADRHATVFDALEIFKYTTSRKLLTYSDSYSGLSIRDLLAGSNSGYLSLSGIEITVKPTEPAPMRRIKSYHVIDKAA